MPLNYELLKNWQFEKITQTFTNRDTIIYALGVGVTVDPMNSDDLKYVYEGDGFVALPTMAVVLGRNPFWIADPRLNLDWKKVLHGEQMLSIYAPIPVEGTITAQEQIEEIYDKGADKGAICYLRRDLCDAATGTLLASVRSAIFLRGDGGFGGISEGAPTPHKLPTDRAPALVVDMPTRSDQAMIYRLAGDMNPLHIDPKVAEAAGFAQPVLHGLCGYGIAGRALIRSLCENDPLRLHALNVRFVNPMMPGDTLRIEVWLDGDARASFRATAVERDVIVLNNGLAEVG